MAQLPVVGLFFVVGLVSGLILSFIVTSYGGMSAVTRVPVTSSEEWVGDIPHRQGGHQHHHHGDHPISDQQLEDIDHLHRDHVPDAPMKIKHVHKEHDEVAQSLYKSVRVLCWVMTQGANHKTRTIHVKHTWGKRCNKVLFISDEGDPDLPAIKIETEKGREHLTAKTMAAFDLAYKNYLKDYDWFLKADDDTYVIVENMRYFLSSQNSSDPIYFGHAFKTIVKQGYFSGGGGYALSREALRRFGQRRQGDCASDHGAEDVELGRCMEKLGVKTGDSRDVLGRSRFHCFNPETHIHGGYPDWYYQYDKYGGKKGIDSVSDYAITFHYISVEQMYNLEFYIYHLRPYGIIPEDEDLNGKPRDSEALTTKMIR